MAEPACGGSISAVETTRTRWRFSESIVSALRAGGTDPRYVLVFVEHPPVYTMGSVGKSEHVLLDRAAMERLGASFREADRGGDVTFHGPGQIVGYPILDLRSWKKDIHAYLRAVETLIIEALSEFGIAGEREPGLTGVWHPRGKIAAVGVRVLVGSRRTASRSTPRPTFDSSTTSCPVVSSIVQSPPWNKSSTRPSPSLRFGTL